MSRGMACIRLTKNDLKEVRNKVLPATSKWYDLGLELGILSDDLDTVKTGNDKPQDCLREVLKRWLDNAELTPTWTTIIIALRSPAVGHHSLAEELEQQVCTKAEINRQNQAATCSTDLAVVSDVTFTQAVSAHKPGSLRKRVPHSIA